MTRTNYVQGSLKISVVKPGSRTSRGPAAEGQPAMFAPDKIKKVLPPYILVIS
jgi:hypothetical protein